MVKDSKDVHIVKVIVLNMGKRIQHPEHNLETYLIFQLQYFISLYLVAAILC